MPDFLLPPRRRVVFFFVAVVFSWPIRWWGGAGLRAEGFLLLEGREGPAEEPREVARSEALGVPGPREDCRREEEVAGMERWWAFRRRRLEGSVEGERLLLRRAERWTACWAAAEGGRAVMRGEGCRAEGWTRRAMGLLAMVVEGPMLPERGCRGMDGLWLVGRGGRRVVMLAL